MRKFWRQHPLFPAAIAFFAGISAPLYHTWPLTLLLFALMARHSPTIARILFAGIAYALLLYPPHSKPLPTEGRFELITPLHSRSSFNKTPTYRGRFEGRPCTARIAGKIPLDRELHVVATPISKAPHHLFLKVHSWRPLEKRHPLTGWRIAAKKQFQRYVHRNIRDRECAAFLISLFSGEVTARWLRFTFQRVGLQHLLAVSGFHFSLLLALLRFLTRNRSELLLFAAATAYFIFLGNSPAVFRTYVMLAYLQLAPTFHRRHTPLNALGFALLLELLIDPLAVSSVSCHLTFAATFGLTVLAPLISAHPNPLRSALTASLAVNLTLLPLLLAHFHKFPLLALPYQLLIPPLVSLAFALFLLAPLIPPLFTLTEHLTRHILNIIAYPPLPLDIELTLPLPPLLAALALLLLIYTIPMLKNPKPATLSLYSVRRS